MKQKRVNWPNIKANDVKVLGQVVTIASNNKLAHAEQIFDKEFDYINYDLTNLIEDGDTKGFDQYTINRLFSSKLVSLEGVVANLSSRVDALEEWKDTVDSKLDKIDTLEACCEDVQSRLSDLEDCCEEVLSKLDDIPTGGGDTSFTVSPNTVNLILGDPLEGSKQLTLSKGSDLTGNFTFTGYNESKISVSSTGLITALSTGSTTITVGVEGFARTEDVVVNISAPTPVEYSLFYKDGTRVIDEQHYVENAVITPIADPVKDGYTFTGWDGMPASMRMPNLNISVYATWTEVIVPETHVYTLEVDPTSTTITAGNTATITATPKDNDNPMTGQTVIWTSSNPAAATVNGGIVTPASGLIAAANTTITATWASPDGNKTATCQVTVNPASVEPETHPVLDITITRSHNSNLQWSNDGTSIPDNLKSVTFTATVTPSNADNTNVTWSCSDNTKVTLTPNGNECTVTARGDTSAEGIKVYATSVGLNESGVTIRREATVVVDLVTTPEVPATRYKVSWTVSPIGSVQVRNATTDNDAYFDPLTDINGDNWTAQLYNQTGYNVSSVTITMGGNDVTSNYLVGLSISIPKSSITDNVVITITATGETPGVQHTVTWNVGEHAHVQNINTESALVNGGTVEHGAYFSMGVVADQGYELNTTTVTMGGTDITSQCVIREPGEDPTTHTPVTVDSIQILSVTDDVVITTTTTAVTPPTTKYTVTYTVNGESGHCQVNNPTTASGGQVDEGSSWTAEFLADNGYYITNKVATMGETNIEQTYGSMSNDASRFVINITNVVGNVNIEVTVNRKPIYVTYVTNQNDAVQLNYGAGGEVPTDRRLTSEDFLTPCSLIDTTGIHNTQIQYGGDEAATFFTLPGYKISNISVVWDGDEPQFNTQEGHNQFDTPVKIWGPQEGSASYNGSIDIEGVRSSGTVTITVIPDNE